MEPSNETDANRPSTTDALSETRAAWRRPTLSRLPLSETLASGGSGTDGGFASLV